MLSNGYSFGKRADHTEIKDVCSRINIFDISLTNKDRDTLFWSKPMFFGTRKWINMLFWPKYHLELKKKKKKKKKSFRDVCYGV